MIGCVHIPAYVAELRSVISAGLVGRLGNPRAMDSCSADAQDGAAPVPS
jgi:hypothetical protein